MNGSLPIELAAVLVCPFAPNPDEQWMSWSREETGDSSNWQDPVYRGYDVLGRTVWSALKSRASVPPDVPLWDIVWYRYDKLGRTTHVYVNRRNSQWDETCYEYETHFDKPTSMALLESGSGLPERVHFYEYNSRGLQIGEDNGTPDQITYEHDQLGRVKRILYAGGAETRFFYDANGRVVKGEVYDNGMLCNTVSRSYNLRGWLESETWRIEGESHTIRYQYDHMGNRIRMTYPNGHAVGFQYDRANRLIGIPGYCDSLAYNDSNFLTSIQFANGVSTSYTPDSRSRIARILTAFQGQTCLDLAYEYTMAGNIGRIVDASDGTATALQFEYSPANQLTYAEVHTSTGVENVEYAYDGAGNRIIENWSDSRGTISYQYGIGNMLHSRASSEGTTEYAWGTYGQLLSKTKDGARTEYHYDARRTMKNVSLRDRTTASFFYDAFGRRVMTMEGMDIKASLHSGNDIVFECPVAGEVTPPPDEPIEILESNAAPDLSPPPNFGARGTRTCYIAANGKYLAKTVQEGENPAKTYFLHTDMLGSIRAITDSAGQVAARFEYEPFGLVTERSGSAASGAERYTGKPFDEGTGLYYFGARYYDPEVGRFTSPDPARDGLNWYIYCANNPLAYIDPDGQAAGPITLGIGILWLAQWAPDLIDRLYVMAVDFVTMAANPAILHLIEAGSTPKQPSPGSSKGSKQQPSKPPLPPNMTIPMAAEKVVDAIRKNANTINHILKGSTNSDHCWDRLVGKNPTWPKIESFVRQTLTSGTWRQLEGHKDIWIASKIFNGLTVEVRIWVGHKLEWAISDAWVVKPK